MREKGKDFIYKSIAIVLGITMLGSLSACSHGKKVEDEQDEIVLNVLAGQSTSDAGIEDMIDEWMLDAFPHVRLEWECVDWGDSFSSQMTGRFAAGNIPDIIIGKAQDVKTYAVTGNLGVISDECAGMITPDALETVTIDEEVYGMPYNAWYQGVIYNKNIFEEYQLEVPSTIEDLKEIINVLKEKKVVPFASHFQQSWNVANMTMQFMMNELFRTTPDWGDQFRAGNVSFSENSIVQTCVENNQLILQSSWEDAIQIEQFESDSRFAQGEAAMYLTGSWSMQFANQYEEDIQFGIFPFPNTTGDARLIREINMTFMKSADTEHSQLIDEIFAGLLKDEKLMQEILDFTQSSPVVQGMEIERTGEIQADIDWYEKQGLVIDVSTGNEQLVWDFQDDFAAQELLWLKNEKTMEDILRYADEKRDTSSGGF